MQTLDVPYCKLCECRTWNRWCGKWGVSEFLGVDGCTHSMRNFCPSIEPFCVEMFTKWTWPLWMLVWSKIRYIWHLFFNCKTKCVCFMMQAVDYDMCRIYTWRHGIAAFFPQSASMPLFCEAFRGLCRLTSRHWGERNCDHKVPWSEKRIQRRNGSCTSGESELHFMRFVSQTCTMPNTTCIYFANAKKHNRMLLVS